MGRKNGLNAVDCVQNLFCIFHTTNRQPEVFCVRVDGNVLAAEAVARVIKRYRKKMGISRDQLAFHLTLHKNTLYGVEVGVKRKSGSFGHTQLTLPNFVRIARFFDITPGIFLEEVLTESNTIKESKTQGA